MTTPIKTTKVKSDELMPKSMKNAVKDEDLIDTTSHLFRKIAVDKLKVNLSTWKTYIDDYIRKIYPDNPDDMEQVKRERSTAIGNINDTLWARPALTFKKLLTGLYILKARRVKITLEVEFKTGKTVSVDEEFYLDIKKEDN